MDRQPSEDRLYAAVLLAFLIGLVALGLLGVPALLVAAIGVAVAALAIAVFHGALESRRGAISRSSSRRQSVPEKYVPRVLESGTMRRRRGVHLRRHRDASPPLRFR
jgi:ABC-type transport system involved in cytochrome bd biosynthesis fused ATPase/permease subunit